MKPTGSDRRPALGEAIFAVYGIHPVECTGAVPRISHGPFRRAAKVLQRRIFSHFSDTK
jgi:hypothetical protein